MNDDYQAVRAATQLKLQNILTGGDTFLTPDRIRAEVQSAIEFIGCTGVDIDRVTAELETSFQTTIGQERVLIGREDGYEPWLLKRKASIEWNFWRRYEIHLASRGWHGTTVEKLDETTDHLLGLLTAPDREGPWDRRGMVVGYVQSGKTSHYVGLICKAVDAGYKLIVVLSGFHKNLRSQTQVRLEEGFLGYNRAAATGRDAPMPLVGVGTIDPSPKADSITTRADGGDFKKSVARNFAINPGGHPLLFVIKKNGTVLKNLLSWVKFFADAKDDQGRSYVRNVPMLVIDDEADQGSIDTTNAAFDETGQPDEDHNPTVLNGRIRKLLHLFDQSAYVGYTATPFANIFIHEKGRTVEEGDDLFPRSFIMSLPSPSNHIGPSKIFGREDPDGHVEPGAPIVRLVEDHADSLALNERSGWMPPRHRIDHRLLFDGSGQLPPSLKEAIRAFVLACAIRETRGDGEAHNSMLVHVTRFTRVQDQVADQVRSELKDLKRRLRFGDGDASPRVRTELRELWEKDFARTTREMAESDCPPHAWNEIDGRLTDVTMSIKVRTIHGQALDTLDYLNHASTGLNVIAIGGDKLSRGLTLEGLSVSYFLRASRMYDTLMQMGRWFGYRPGYLDLCRLYTTPEMSRWFYHIASATDELREDFDRMEASGGTPLDFGHRVKSHPMLLVTSQVKMRHGTRIDVTFQGDICETINFWRTRPRSERNWNAATALVARIEGNGRAPEPVGHTGGREHVGRWKWTEVDPDAVIDFLSTYREHDASRKVKTKLLADYIRLEAKSGRLTSWTVLVGSGESNREVLGGARFQLVERRWHLAGRDGDDALVKKDLLKQGQFRIRRLVSNRDEFVDLSDDQYPQALELTREAWRKDPKGREEPTIPAGRFVREVRDPSTGLLILYPLNSRDGTGMNETDKVEDDAKDVPVLGFAVSFPSVDSREASKVTYIVGNVYWDQELGYDSSGEDEGS